MDVFSRIEHIMNWGRANDYNMMIMSDPYKGVMMFEKNGVHFEISMETINEMELGDIALLIDRTYDGLVKDQPMQKFSILCEGCNSVTTDFEMKYDVEHDIKLIIKCDQCGNEDVWVNG